MLTIESLIDEHNKVLAKTDVTSDIDVGTFADTKDGAETKADAETKPGVETNTQGKYISKCFKLFNKKLQFNLEGLTALRNLSNREFLNLEQYAEKGDRRAQYDLGMCYRYGYHVRQDKFEAFSLFNLAARSFHSAYWTLGDFFLDTEFVGLIDYNKSERELKAFEYYQRAAVQGLAVAQYTLANLYQADIGIPQKEKRKRFVHAFKWYKKAAMLGLPEANYSLAKCYKDNIGIPMNESESRVRLKKAAEYYQIAENLRNPLARQDLSTQFQQSYSDSDQSPKPPLSALLSANQPSLSAGQLPHEFLSRQASVAQPPQEALNEKTAVKSREKTPSQLPPVPMDVLYQEVKENNEKLKQKFQKLAQLTESFNEHHSQFISGMELVSNRSEQIKQKNKKIIQLENQSQGQSESQDQRQSQSSSESQEVQNQLVANSMVDETAVTLLPLYKLQHGRAENQRKLNIDIETQVRNHKMLEHDTLEVVIGQEEVLNDLQLRALMAQKQSFSAQKLQDISSIDSRKRKQNEPIEGESERVSKSHKT